MLKRLWHTIPYAIMRHVQNADFRPTEVPPRLYPLATAATALPGAMISAGGVESRQDPRRPEPDLFAMNGPGPLSLVPTQLNLTTRGWLRDGDPFVYPAQMDMFRARDLRLRPRAIRKPSPRRPFNGIPHFLPPRV